MAESGYYVADKQLNFKRVLTEATKSAQNECAIALNEIKAVLSVFGTHYMTSGEGEKVLIRYRPEPAPMIAEIKAAMGRFNGQA